MSSIQSIERAFSILQSLAVGPAGVSEIASRVALPKSTVARMLSTLEQVGAVERADDSSDYRIGKSIGELAGSVDASDSLIMAVRPHLAHLAEHLGETAGFSVPVGYSTHYLVQAEGPNAVQVRDYSGLRVPMHVGPSGLCIMANWPAAEIDRYLSRDLESFTPRTVTDPSTIRDRLEAIRAQGFFWIEEEYAEGITSVASAVFDLGGQVLGAIHVHGPSYRFPEPGREAALGREVQAAAVRFSQRPTPGRP